MSLRKLAAVTSAVALALVFNLGAAAAGRDRTAPTTPTNLRITASTATSVSLAWNASTDKSGPFWYCVQNGGSGCIRVDPPQTTLTRTKLLPSTTFTFTVYAIDRAGNRSGNSNAVTFTTPGDTTAPSPPPTISATSVLPTRISVAWTASVDNLSQVWYTLIVDGSPFGSDLIGYRAATVFYLEPASTHVFKVTARDAYGNVVESNTLSVTTPSTTDSTPPTPPSNLRLSSESMAPEAWLDWNQSTDNADPQAQILYEVYLNGVRNDDGIVGYGSTITYCRVPGPTEIVLRAVDTSGNRSGPSNAIAFSC